jgi:hypothetical protein
MEHSLRQRLGDRRGGAEERLSNMKFDYFLARVLSQAFDGDESLV